MRLQIAQHKSFYFPKNFVLSDSTDTDLKVTYRLLGVDSLRQEMILPNPYTNEEFVHNDFIKENDKKQWTHFIEWCEKCGLIKGNPGTITDAEKNLLLRGNKTSEQLREIIEIGLETGMRQSEILNIHPEHIKDQTLFIPVAKTKPRLIPLTKKALSVLKNATLPFNIDRHLLGKRFRRLCKHYRIKDAHFHDLRKQSLTNFMKDKKLNVPDTMLIAGHKDPRMLLRIYNNLQVADVAKKLN